MAILGALGDLVLALSADTSKFQSDLGRAQRAAEKFGKEVGKTLGNLAGALIAVSGAAGMGALIRSQIDAADAAGKMAQKIGTSTEALSSYLVAARLSNVSNEQLQVGFRTLAKNQADFIRNAGESREAFMALGITQQQIKDLGGDNAKIFELIAGKLAKFEDGANKTALAMAFFGKSGAELIPLINSLEETRDKAERLGQVIDSNTAKAAERFNDTMTEVSLAMQGMGLHIARALLPALTELAEKLLTVAANTERMEQAARIADGGIRLLVSSGTIIVAVFNSVGKILGAVAASLVAMAKGEYKQAILIMMEAGADLAKDTKEMVKDLQSTWASYGDATRTAGLSNEQLLANNERLADSFNRSFLAAKQAAPGLRNLAEETRRARDAAREAEEAFKAMAAAINRAFEDAMATIDADKEIERIARAQRDLQTDIDEMIEKARTNPRQGDEEGGLPPGMGAEESEQQRRKLEALRQSLLTEEEMELEAHEKKMEMVREMTDRELEALGGRQAVIEEMEQQHQERLFQIRSRGLRTLNQFTKASFVQQAQTIFGELASITAGVAQHDKKMFELNKIAATANAIINTYQGITRTLATYPWPIAGVMAALHAAAGFAQVRAIQSATFGGGAAPSVVGTVAATPVSPVGTERPSGPTQTTIVNLPGEDFISTKNVRRLLKEIEESTRGGARVVVA